MSKYYQPYHIKFGAWIPVCSLGGKMIFNKDNSWAVTVNDFRGKVSNEIQTGKKRIKVKVASVDMVRYCRRRLKAVSL